MPNVDFGGKNFTIDEDGFIDSFDNWCPEWVQHVKKEEGIDELSDEHWKVIDVLQDYYKKNGIAPMVRVLSKVTGFKLKHIYELFPSGPGKAPVKWQVFRNRPVVYSPANVRFSQIAKKGPVNSAGPFYFVGEMP